MLNTIGHDRKFRKMLLTAAFLFLTFYEVRPEYQPILTLAANLFWLWDV